MLTNVLSHTMKESNPGTMNMILVAWIVICAKSIFTYAFQPEKSHKDDQGTTGEEYAGAAVDTAGRSSSKKKGKGQRSRARRA